MIKNHGQRRNGKTPKNSHIILKLGILIILTVGVILVIFLIGSLLLVFTTILAALLGILFLVIHQTIISKKNPIYSIHVESEKGLKFNPSTDELISSGRSSLDIKKNDMK